MSDTTGELAVAVIVIGAFLCFCLCVRSCHEIDANKVVALARIAAKCPSEVKP